MIIRTLTVLAITATLASCQDEPKKPAAPQDPDKLLKEMLASFDKEKVKIDAKKGTVTIPAVVNPPQDPIEYLLIHRRGKKHEAVFWTKTKPSVLNAALLMLGMEKGSNATYKEKVPAPTLEEVQAGADPLIVTPPKGKPFWMTARWKDEDGKPVEHCVEDLLLDLTTQKPMGACKWVYLGGRMAQLYKGDPEVFIADFEGNLVSVCYLTPDNHLATMVHERARDDQNWWTTKLVPEPGTELEFVFHSKKPKLHEAREQRLKAEAAKAKK
ncbi:MAG: YdjY domain-containing protein [Planctomycetota bacterium]